ncbi:hypothetical protein BXT84_10270 [Sulfobacillus thermotolerans]|uniref:DUF4232 domain-containing protein n=1 Tax=Sulfobacillus thermotolerans TaxID=338644 RepID=A0ABM6RSJ6_9FIRM|nr:hypothetical protein BXT84_10270 [Sulfobacillus thermotolerans]
MRRHVSIVASVAVGVFSLAGCGVSRYLAANPTGNGAVRVSHIVPRTGLKLSRSMTSSSTGSTTVTTPTHGHSTGTLKVTIVHSAVAAGADGGVIHFTNIGRSPVSLRGWSTVVGITAAGNQSHPAVRRDSTMFGPYFGHGIPNVPTVTLKPGRSAEETFIGSDMPGQNGKAAIIYHQLRITPPGSTRSFVVSAWLPYADAYFSSSSGIEVSVIARTKEFNP